MQESAKVEAGVVGGGHGRIQEAAKAEVGVAGGGYGRGKG